jgi:hypothetical protein
MGNAAGIVASIPDASDCELAGENSFTQVESYCRHGVFQKKDPAIFQQYRQLVERSIQKSQLDTLELLIAAGRIREVYPLHTGD